MDHKLPPLSGTSSGKKASLQNPTTQVQTTNNIPPQRHVFVRIIFLKVGEISTTEEKFSADVYIQARWQEPALNHAPLSSRSDPNSHWSPKLLIANLLDATKHITWREVAFNKDGKAFVLEKRRIEGHFMEKLELDDFPFDQQALNVQISSELPSDDLDLVEDQEEISAINPTCFVDEQEWSLYDYIEFEKQTTVKEFSPKRHIEFPWLVAGFCAVRRAGFFSFNIITIMTLICSISLATFAVNRTLTQNRLQLSIMLMLTSVTFKSTAVQNLPKISYYTHLDRFILFDLIFTYLVGIWHAVVSRFEYNSSLADDMDMWAFIVSSALFVGFHLLYALYLLVLFMIRRNNLQRKEAEYTRKSAALLGKSWIHNRHKHKQRNKGLRSYGRRGHARVASMVMLPTEQNPEPDLNFFTKSF